MSETKQGTTLFFIKNIAHQFGPVEKFLKKRGYTVVIETDIKTALDRILEENPEYIFLAWDHKNENIRLMPKTIYQSCTGQVVPFIMSTQRDQIIQLESSGFENKLYPPLSGPAIIRVISKYEKKNQIFEQASKKPVAEKKKQSEMIQVKSFFNEEDSNDPEINLNSSGAARIGERQKMASRSRSHSNKFMSQSKRKSSGQMNSAIQKGFNNRKMSSILQEGAKNKMMSVIEEQLSKNEKLTHQQKVDAQKSLMKAIEQQIAKDASQDKMMLAIEEEFAKLSELTPDEQLDAKGQLILIIEDELAQTTNDTEDDSDDVPMSEKISDENKRLSEEQIKFLDESFTETVKPELFDTIEAFADQESPQLDLTVTTQIYVLIVQELEWTGYLTVASESYLDRALAQDILNDWIKRMIRVEKVDQDASEGDVMPDATLMEIRIPKVDFTEFCSYKSEFFKNIDYKGKKTMLGFFSFSPYQVINSVHLNFDILELPIDFLQPNKNLPFDVNLWMQENKKFILYVRPGSFLEDQQIERLQKNKVKYIFSHMEYELPLLKYKAEFNIKNLVESYTSIKGPKK